MTDEIRRHIPYPNLFVGQLRSGEVEFIFGCVQTIHNVFAGIGSLLKIVINVIVIVKQHIQKTFALGAEFHRVVAQKIVGFLDGLEKLIIVYERKTANIRLVER